MSEEMVAQVEETTQTTPESLDGEAGTDDDISLDLSDTPEPVQIAASAPAPTGLAGTGILSPLAALQQPAATANGGAGGGGSVGGGVRRGRGGSAGSAGYLSRFINCDFEPGKPDSPWNFSSKVWAGQAEAGICSDPTYYKAYKTELQMVQDTTTQFGTRWQGNGKIGRWTAPFIKPDGTVGERIVEAVNPPASVIEVRESMAASEAKARERALQHGATPATSSSTAQARQGAQRGVSAPHPTQILDLEGEVVQGQDADVLDVDMSDVGPKKAPPPPPPAPRQPKAVVGVPTKPAVQPTPPEEVMSLEEALAAANVGTEEAAPVPTTAPNDFGEPPSLEVEEVKEEVILAEKNGEGPPFLEGREEQFGLNDDGTPTEALQEEMAPADVGSPSEEGAEPVAAGASKRQSKRGKK